MAMLRLASEAIPLRLLRQPDHCRRTNDWIGNSIFRRHAAWSGDRRRAHHSIAFCPCRSSAPTGVSSESAKGGEEAGVEAVQAIAVLRAFEIGRHRLQFVYQAPHAFDKANHPEWVAQMKSDAGFAKLAGIELVLLDCARYFHRAAGINGVAQIVKDLGAKADSRKLAKIAAFYENSSVRRLGYLLELAGHARQAKALEPFANKAKSVKLLDPSVKSFIASLASPLQKDPKWMLVINEPVEIDY